MAATPALRRRGHSFKDVVEVSAQSKKKVSTFQEQHFFKPPHLLRWEDAPSYLQENRFIRAGYRPVSSSTRACLQSWLYLHNESMNIYTHLLPAVCFIITEATMTKYLERHYPSATKLDHLVFGFFLATTFVCLALSALYHTFISHSHENAVRFLKLDFVGIVVQILGSFASGVYMGYRCSPPLHRMYWTMIMTFGLSTIAVTIQPKYQRPEYQTLRTGMFVATAASGFIPIIHGLFLFGVRQSIVQSGLPYYLLEGAFFGCGTYFYISRFPESRWPGKFDIWFNSHSNFHILVVLATLTHFAGILSAYDYNYNHMICPVAAG